MTGRMSYHAGLAAEDCVARDYERRGHAVLQHRWRGRHGELDLILEDGDRLIFVEVKKSKSHDRALERVSQSQTRRMFQAAEEFVAKTSAETRDLQFDLATVDASGDVAVHEAVFWL